MNGIDSFSSLDSVFVVAEAGVNHNGSLDTAKQMAYEAKEAGADAVKFQTSIPEKSMSRFAELAEYQEKNIGKRVSMLDMARSLSLTFKDFERLKRYCDEIGLLFLSTPFHTEAAVFLNDLVPFFKVSSGEIVNKEMLEFIGSTGKPVILSTGMSCLGDIEDAFLYLNSQRDKVALLHCTTNYPCPYEEVNLKAMLTLKEAFKTVVGYSDHTLGIEVPIAAVAMGAKIIEKHFTLDRSMKGPDHAASLEPSELNRMIACIRNLEKALGSGIKEPNPSERRIMLKTRKSLTAKSDIERGTILTKENVTFKKPGTGIPPKFAEIVLGRKVVKDIRQDETITWDHMMEE